MIPTEDMARRRALGIAGAAALMVVWLACVVLIAGVLVGGGEEEDARVQAPAATGTPEPTPTPTPDPTPVPLTPQQRALRSAAAELVRSKGFEPVRLRDYDPTRTLRVLIGNSRTGTKLAFFFVGETYIGNDRSTPSTDLRVVRRRDTQTTLAYGDTRVRFQWDGVRLAPLDPLPDGP